MSGDSEKQQILEQMQKKDTDELVQIWKAHDRTEWTETAFEIIRDILLERLGELPQQNDGNDQTESADEEVDTYHNPDHLLRIAVWGRALSQLFLILGILLIIGNIGYILITVSSASSSSASASAWFVTVYLFVLLFVPAIVSLFFFVLLRAMAEGICLLMDIEDNTRKREDKQIA
jgi:hypothetical protein